MTGYFTRTQQRRGIQGRRARVVAKLLLPHELPTPKVWRYEPQAFPVGWSIASTWQGLPAVLVVVGTRCEHPHPLRDEHQPLARHYELEMRCGHVVMRRWMSQRDLLERFNPPRDCGV